MKNTIILFDIDETLFDPQKYLTLVFSHVAKILHVSETIFSQEAWELFRKFREKEQRFTPDVFAEVIARKYMLSFSDTAKIFWDEKLFAEALYSDVMPTLKKLAKDCFLGILSTGDIKFQQEKIAPIVHMLEKDALHIFAAKEKELQHVLQKYKEKRIFYVDDREDMLRLAKNIHPEIHMVLIERKGQKEKESITSLNDLVSLVNG